MERLPGKLIEEMTSYEGSEHGRVNHFLKVFAYARAIALLEGIGDEERRNLEAAAVLHDVGIKVSEQKYGSGTGRYQEIEGPPIAREILERCGVPEKNIQRICYLIGHHHTYTDVEGMDYQILLEADFLVNFEEGGMPMNEKMRGLFRTKSGKTLLNNLFGSEAPSA